MNFSMINVIYPCDNCIMERYRSGHNEADSKSVVQQCTVGSNPATPTARNQGVTIKSSSFFCCSNETVELAVDLGNVNQDVNH